MRNVNLDYTQTAVDFIALAPEIGVAFNMSIATLSEQVGRWQPAPCNAVEASLRVHCVAACRSAWLLQRGKRNAPVCCCCAGHTSGLRGLGSLHA
jgi:hypothetical protein